MSYQNIGSKRRIKIKKLEEIFNLPPSNMGTRDDTDYERSSEQITSDDVTADDVTANVPGVDRMSVDEKRELAHQLDDFNEKINAALPAIRGLELEDTQLDEISTKCMTAFDDLMTLGYNVDSRFSSEIFNAAGSMAGHALAAKTAKINKKMKTIELQMRKLKLDSDLRKAAAAGRISEDDDLPVASGHILSRNELLDMIQGSRDNSDNTGDGSDNEKS